jgi:hypothetical protein
VRTSCALLLVASLAACRTPAERFAELGETVEAENRSWQHCVKHKPPPPKFFVTPLERLEQTARNFDNLAHIASTPECAERVPANLAMPVVALGRFIHKPETTGEDAQPAPAEAAPPSSPASRSATGRTGRRGRSPTGSGTPAR